MKRFQLLVCAALIFSTLGCATQREQLSSQPVNLADTTPARPHPLREFFTPVGTVAKHPVRDAVKDAARTVGAVIATPFLVGYIALSGGLGGLPKC